LKESLPIRLEGIISLSHGAEVGADVGCDHALLTVAMVQRGLWTRAYASDVRKGPLERAAAHVAESGLEDRIETRLASGLDGLKKDQVQSVVMAGMGGHLMAELLRTSYEEPDGAIHGLRELILQPQSELELVRKTVYELGFVITREKILKDREKTYWIFRCEPGTDEQEKAPQKALQEEWTYYYGTSLAEQNDPLFWAFLDEEEAKLLKLKEKIEKESENEAAGRKRLEEINHRLEAIGKERAAWK